MTAALILWGHALAALAFGVLGLDLARRRGSWPRTAFVVALAATALWALTVAGIDADDVANAVALTIRNLAWLVVMGLFVRRDRSAGVALAAVYAMAVAMTIATTTLALVGTAPLNPEGLAALVSASLTCRMMAAVAALVLVHHFDGAAPRELRWVARPAAVILGVMWGWDLTSAAFAYVGGTAPAALIAGRGFAMLAVALLFGLTARVGESVQMTVSRSVAMRVVSTAALILYASGTLWLTALAQHAPDGYARIAQTAVVLGSATALMTLLSTPWLRAWTRVKLAKHLFRHRYDYRVEWQRFTTTLGLPGPDADPLERRIIKAIADLVDAPAGLLLTPRGAGLAPATSWCWEGAGTGGAPLAAHLQATARIVEIDSVRRRSASDEEAAAVPDWMVGRDDAWILVPLIHHAALVGAILLARPPVDRALDWEDLDLLRISGRQAASYLAEDRAHGALADAQRFDEFNRRFAFILHDLKNLVSGLTLVARNAERHADNPAFRADMIATLQDSAARMNSLLAKLTQHHQPPTVRAQPLDIAALANRMASARRAQHRIEVTGNGVAVAQPGRVEQVLDQLVRNAIEASAPTEAVAIRIATHDTQVAIEVADRGCGMTPAFVHDQLFRPFVSTKPDGFGLGAYEARQLVEAMGGTITVESQEGAGTRFTIRLPAALALETAA